MNKKGFTLIELMIVVAIIAILAMIAIPMYQRYIERSRNSASQNLLHHLSTAMTAYNVDSSEYMPNATFPASGQQNIVGELLPYGFRPDPNVGFEVLAPAIGVYKDEPGFVAFAAHKAKGSRLYVYDNLAASGVQPMATDSKTLVVGTAKQVDTAAKCTGTLNVWVPDPADASKVATGTPPTISIDTATGLVQ